MTKRETLEAKINIYKQWLSMLISGKYNEKSLGLPDNVSIQDEIDRMLDLLIQLRKDLKNLED